jgi:hypothetical protein
MDWLYVSLILVFFALSGALVCGCELLRKPS